jgi:hypothetical protein
MKKLLRSDFIKALFAIVITLGLADLSLAVGKKEAHVTQVIQDVRLLPSKAAPRPAALNDSVREGTAVRTGSDSRAELTYTDQTLTRLGANTLFSFTQGGRDFDLSSGAMLICVPKEAGTTRINTPAVTAAVTGFTALSEYHPKSWYKFIVLEGVANLSLRNHPGEKLQLHAGQMITLPPGATKFPKPHNVDLKKLIRSALLITQFPKLPSWAWNAILAEVDRQQTSPPSGGYIDPTSQETIDQKAATEMTPKPRMRHPEQSPPTDTLTRPQSGKP